MHLGDVAVRSCTWPVSTVGTQAITTIEGLSDDGDHGLVIVRQDITATALLSHSLLSDSGAQLDVTGIPVGATAADGALTDGAG